MIIEEAYNEIKEACEAAHKEYDVTCEEYARLCKKTQNSR